MVLISYTHHIHHTQKATTGSSTVVPRTGVPGTLAGTVQLHSMFRFRTTVAVKVLSAG